jgi:protein gp37
MGENSAISWTDHTFNPWWGCARVSPGCQHCYAETFARRTGNDVWGQAAPRRFFGDKHWAEPLRWNARAEQAGVRARVFCASMADVFEDRDDLVPERARLVDLIERTPWLDWLLLTKRPENVRDMVPGRWLWTATVINGAGAERVPRWPANVWVGTTVEDQTRAYERLPWLLELPTPVRFLSCEPLLGPVDLTWWLHGIGWVIVGGESGPKHRPLNLDHARSLRDQCTAAGVPFFFKQVGGRTPTTGGHLLDGVEWHQFPTITTRQGEVA